MQYMLMLYVNEAGWPKLTPAEQEQGMAAYSAYTAALTKAGVVHEYYELPYADYGYDFNFPVPDFARRGQNVRSSHTIRRATRAGMELLTNSNSKDRFWHKTDVGRIVFRGPVAAGKRTSLISAYNVR